MSDNLLYEPYKKPDDFDFREEFQDKLGVAAYAEYMVDFRLRHPILYYLGYRWWLMRTIPPESRQLVKIVLRVYGGREAQTWAVFAKYHPVMYLFGLLLLFIFQPLVKLFTAPVKIICALQRKSSIT